ncbi:immunomodulatory protein [Mycena amicta]|nr:immunomodulatory protein [Mycena amicta]
MKTKFSALASLALFAVAAVADSVAYDQTYDNGSNSMDIVACSNGANGLITRFGFETFSDIPNFPFIGAAGAVEGFNSVHCGECWQLTYTPANGAKKTINVVAIDHAGPGTFNIALEAMNTLTNNQAVQLGRVNVVATKVASSVCGLPV